tara:strand:+ start:4233 stop:4556 length:324 start_codon:yes stop_codon:yes gene_type:complete
MIYDEAFKVPSNLRHEWIVNTLKKSRKTCLRNRRYLLHFMKIAVNTQRIFDHCKYDTVLIEDEIAKVNKMMKSKINYIKDHMLHHIYKPSGRMFLKSCEEIGFFISK